MLENKFWLPKIFQYTVDCVQTRERGEREAREGREERGGGEREIDREIPYLEDKKRLFKRQLKRYRGR